MSQSFLPFQEVVPSSSSEFPTSLLIDADQLAKILNISIRSVWRYQSSNKIPSPVRLGGSVRWRRAEIVHWINDGCPPLDDE